MTLVAGLTGVHCGVMLADSQETVSGFAKKSVDKLEFFGAEAPGRYEFVLGGAGDSGPYIDRFNQELSHTLLETEADNYATLQRELDETTRVFHEKHIWPQGKDAPVLETIIMLRRNQRGLTHCDLVHVHRTAVNFLINASSKSVGIGSYLADYLCEQFFDVGGSENQLLAMSVYLPQQAKSHVDGVGLNGRIVMFRSDGEIEELDQADIQPVEDILRELDGAMRLIFSKISCTKPLNEGDQANMSNLVQELRELKSKYASAVDDIAERRMQS